VTDDLGNFSIEKLPAGRYYVNISSPRNTYLSYAYGQKKPGGPSGTLALADGEKFKLNVSLTHSSAILGTVLNEDGDPLPNVPMRAWRWVNNSGIRRLQSIGFAQTDDRGVYRLFGLQPGDYLVSATPDMNGALVGGIDPQTALIEKAIASGPVIPPAAPGLPATVVIPVLTPQQMADQRQIDGPPPGYLPVFHPGTLTASSATIVHVNGGEEKAGVDIQVRLVQATNIKGTIQNMPANGVPVQISLVNDDPAAEGSTSSRADKDGRFTFRAVSPGKYTVLANVISASMMSVVNGVMVSAPPRPLDDTERLWGRAVVTVEGQAEVAASISLAPPRTISGFVNFEMERRPDFSRSKVMVALSQAPGVSIPFFGPMPQAEVAFDGSFTLKGVTPGKYVLRAQGIQKSCIINGEDVLDFPLNFTGERDISGAIITVIDKPSEVSGTLTDAAGKVPADYSIIVASSDERYWTPGSRRIAVTRPGADGQFTIRNLPAGGYILAAVTDLESGGQYDPAFLKALAAEAGMHIAVADGATLTQNVRIK